MGLGERVEKVCTAGKADSDWCGVTRRWNTGHGCWAGLVGGLVHWYSLWSWCRQTNSMSIWVVCWGFRDQSGGGWGGGGRIDEVWNLGTMFWQLTKRSTRMLVSGIFKQLRTFVVIPNVLSKFSKIGSVLQMKNMMSASIEITLYWAWLIILEKWAKNERNDWLCHD